MNCLFPCRPHPCRSRCKVQPRRCLSSSCSSRNSSPCRRPAVCSRGCSPSPSCERCGRRKCHKRNVAVNTCVPSYESDTFSSVMRKMDKFCCGHQECSAFPVCRHALGCSACETTPKGPCYYPPCLPEPSCMPGLRFSEPSCNIPIQVQCKGRFQTCSDPCKPKISPCLPKIRPCKPCDSCSPCSNPCTDPCKIPSTVCTECRRRCRLCSRCNRCMPICKYGYPCYKKPRDPCSPCHTSSSCPICAKYVCKPVCSDPCKTVSSDCSKIVCSDPCKPRKPCKAYQPCKYHPCKPRPCKPYPCKPYPCNPYPCKPYPCKPYPCKLYPCKPSRPCSRGPCIVKKIYQNKFPSSGITNYQRISINVNQPNVPPKSSCCRLKSNQSVKLGSRNCPARALPMCQDCGKIKLKKKNICPKEDISCCKTNIASCPDVFGPCPLLKLPKIKIDPACPVVQINNSKKKCGKKKCRIACN